MSTGHQPLISVVLVVRNASATVGRTLTSLAAQHWTDFEVVIADGASTDTTLAVPTAG